MVVDAPYAVDAVELVRRLNRVVAQMPAFDGVTAGVTLTFEGYAEIQLCCAAEHATNLVPAGIACGELVVADEVLMANHEAIG